MAFHDRMIAVAGVEAQIMSDSERENEGTDGTDARQREFRTTNWNLVLTASDPRGEGAEAALESLCRDYWFPLYAFVRRRGHAPSQAEDLTQGFFEHLLESNALVRASPERGRFRTFLLKSIQNFLANEWDRAHRQKRGGTRELIWWDGLEPEERFALEPMQEGSPELLFDRHWAQALMESAMNRLRTEAERDDDASRFELLKVFLTHSESMPSYAEIGSRLQLGENAVKSAIFRLRRRFALLVRDEIGKTVQAPSDVEEELRHLFAASSA